MRNVPWEMLVESDPLVQDFKWSPLIWFWRILRHFYVWRLAPDNDCCKLELVTYQLVGYSLQQWAVDFSYDAYHAKWQRAKYRHAILMTGQHSLKFHSRCSGTFAWAAFPIKKPFSCASSMEVLHWRFLIENLKPGCTKKAENIWPYQPMPCNTRLVWNTRFLCRSIRVPNSNRRRTRTEHVQHFNLPNALKSRFNCALNAFCPL